MNTQNSSAMADITIPWGDESLTLRLPGGWTVQQVAAPDVPPAPCDWPERLANALTRPEGMPALGHLLSARRSGRIAVVVEDLTRHSPLPRILEVLFRELRHARVPDENVEIFLATGMHPAPSPEQVAEKIGPDLAGRIAWRANPWTDPQAYVSLGRVELPRAGRLPLWIDRRVAGADLRILVSSVSPHLQAGFGGGYKMLVPGCSGLSTIRRLHLAGVPRRPLQQVGQLAEENPMRRLIDAAGKAIDAAGGISFSIQYVLDARDQPAAIAVGDVAVCQRMLAKRCAAGYGVLVDAPADVVIANAHPRDFDLWQSFKAIAHCCWAARRDGVIVCLARCPAGVNMPTPSLPVGSGCVRRIVRLLGADAVASLATRLVPSLSGDAAFFVRLALQLLQRNSVLLASPALAEAGRTVLGLSVFADPTEAFQAADAQLAGGPKQVIVFPSGGSTYPVLRA